MTDRLSGFVVTLEKNMRDDDAQSTIEAIAHIRGVLSVKPIVADLGQAIAEERTYWDIRAKIIAALDAK